MEGGGRENVLEADVAKYFLRTLPQTLSAFWSTGKTLL